MRSTLKGRQHDPDRPHLRLVASVDATASHPCLSEGIRGRTSGQGETEHPRAPPGSCGQDSGSAPRHARQGGYGEGVMAFLLNVYEVKVIGFPPSLYDARTAGRARAEAWRRYSEARGTTFREFMSLCRVRRVDPPEGFGQPILVSGRPAYRCLGTYGQYVRFARDDSDVVMLSHPMDVSPALTEER